jgi:2OG-Fe(II) oxygenase superfamily
LKHHNYYFTAKKGSYKDGAEGEYHYDWYEPGEDDEVVAEFGNRISSIFAYLDVNCTGGTTEFPQIPKPLEPEWCDFLVCKDENGDKVEHLEIRPILGNAIFWWNLGTDGKGDGRTLHAGLPVIKGTKAGLNIWAREKEYRQPKVDSDSEEEVDDEYMIPYSSYLEIYP